jgi:predicted NBD/HSP70 family sugar kinase
MYISVDMGGTNTRVAGIRRLERLEFVGDPLRRRNTNYYEDDLQYIINASKQIAGRTAVKAVGIGTPGTPTMDRMAIASATNIPHWNDQPLVAPISESLDCPVYFENDAVTAGLGEAYYGDQNGANFHYLIWGTGIGGASIEHDERGNVIDAVKLHWKSHYGEWAKELGGGPLGKRYGAPEKFSNDQWQDILSRFSGYLLRYVDNFEPPAIVFGGGLADRHRNRLVSLSGEAGTNISVSNFKGDSGIVGSFGLIRYEMNRPSDRPRYNTLEDLED